jgi:hypothetical protein
MSALMTPSRRGRRGRPARREAAPPQASLFAAAPATIDPPSPSLPPEPEPRPEAPGGATTAPATAGAVSADTSTTARAHRQGPTLDDLVAGVWEGLLAGAPADCPACGTVMTARHSAGAGVVGGRCGGCGSTLS